MKPMTNKPLVAAPLTLGLLLSAVASLSAQTMPKTFSACYVEKTGTVYLIGEPTLPTQCAKGKDFPFTWIDGLAGYAHGLLNGLADDDHPQYLLADGTRSLAGHLNAGGHRITGLGAGMGTGDAVRFEQAVKVGDAAGGDLGGTYPNPSVAKLQGRAVSSATPSSGQVLSWDGSAWAPRTPAAGNASATSENIPSTLVLRDGLGGFRAGAITGATLSTPRLLTTALGVGIGGPDGDGIVNINARDWGITSSGEMTGKSLGVTGSITSATLSTPRLLSTALGVGIGGPDGDGIVNINARDWGITSSGEMTGKSLGVTGSITGGLIASTSGGFRFPDGTVQTTAGGGGGASDHGLLGGLTDDDHTQYLLADGVRASTNGFAVTGTVLTGSIPATGFGARLMWYPGKAAFRAGYIFGGRGLGDEWDDANIGLGSIATGQNTIASESNSTAMGGLTTASGAYSTAMGLLTIASNHSATAMGLGTTASGENSTAMGGSTTASGQRSTAMGTSTTASGSSSTAMGLGTTASGDFSTAMGYRASTNGHEGSFVFGDFSVLNAFTDVVADNSFVVRTQHVWFGTSSNQIATAGRYIETSTGAYLSSGGDWTNASDVNRKENFRDADARGVLERLSRMPIRTWNYRAENDSIRHLGPTAQDFYAAFQLGDSDKAIGTVDAAGVSLLAIQALERRTRDLDALRAQVAALVRANEQLRAELTALRTARAAATVRAAQ